MFDWKLALVLFLSFNLLGCDKQQAVGDNLNKASSSISVSNARIRAMPPGQKVTALFMDLFNSSLTSVDLIAVKDPAGALASQIELHQNTHVDGMMKMAQVDKITIPAQSHVSLQTGGYHVMIIGLNKTLQVGDKEELELIFSDGSKLVIHPLVKKI